MSKINLRKILNISEVLIVDEITTLTEQHKNTLELFFKKVHYSSCLKEAQEIYNRAKIDIIFSEFMINEQRSFEFLANIRQYNQSIPIVIVTQNATKELLIDFIPLGLTSVNEKPFDISNLIHTLNNLAKVLLKNGQKTINIDENISYDYTAKSVITNIKTVKLTKKESVFLELLLSKHGKVFTKQDIEYHIWGEEIVSDSTFKSLIKRVRDKVGKEYIKNSAGLGYYLIKR